MNKTEKEERSSELSQFYTTFVWPDDPESERGQGILKKGDVKILEVCVGVDFGGVALSKLLTEEGSMCVF